MANEQWPGDLPTALLKQGFREEWPDISLRTQMDAGVDKVRPEFTAGVERIQGILSLTDVQRASLRAFYFTTLAYGSKRFDWTHPTLLTTVTFRFLRAPAVTQPPGSVKFRAAVQLEILP